MADNNFYEFSDHFLGTQIFNTTQANNTGWRMADTSSAGTPVYALVTPSASGEVSVAMDTQAEVQNVCLYQGDVLQYDIDTINQVDFVLKMNQSTLTSAKSTFTFGVTGDRNSDVDAIAQSAIFQVLPATPTLVSVSTDDATTDSGVIATGKTLINAYKKFTISFAQGTSDVRFFIDGQPVATSTTFDMSAYTGSLQLFFQISKLSDANANGFTVDFVKINGRVALT
jgi:hypothetical protein